VLRAGRHRRRRECKAQDTQLFENWAQGAVQNLVNFDGALIKGQGAIEKNQATIGTAIDTGFAAVGKGLGGLQTAQQSLDTQLNQRIESALAGVDPAAAFEIPASAGGYLDATPIGVKQIVTNALTAMLANGQPVASTAHRDLALATDALTAKQYKKAFHYYQMAYQEIAAY
jgi:hypothetical protein